MTRILTIGLLFLSGLYYTAQGQTIPALSFEIKKPQKLENKKLGSEKTGEKKFTPPRRLVQNTVTKFNWHFNANEKLKAILARAKDQFRDDYTKLLPFYNFTTAMTARDSVELDSVIYKANAGILLHDLRNDWVDNMYMLMGKAYYFRQEFDTAFLTFQYINYAFSPKEKDGYDKPIGSNANEGGNAFSISTPESRSIGKKLLNRPPSRNESFLWLIRTYLARDEYPEAAGMIETLKHDPLFPARLSANLAEMQALWFYQREMPDSAAFYLEKALPVAENREETARWEFLIGQLYEMSGKNDIALGFYEQAIKHTLNPVLEVYARLNSIRQHKGDDKVIDENIAALVKMARKDRYTNYRDIIYYSAAQMELERSNRDGAKALLKLSATSSSDQPADRLQKSRSYLQLADLSFADGNYADAKSFYDSVQMTEVVPDPEQFEKRKSVLTSIASNTGVITRQDSLQKIAALPEAERDAYVRKLLRKLRKQQGLQEDDPAPNTNNPLLANNTNTVPELFDNSKGDWYFYNAALKAKGFTEFKNKWGNRPNADNWRRLDAVNQALQQKADKTAIDAKAKAAGTDDDGVLSVESLTKKLPLTPEQLTASNDSIQQAQVAIGKALMEGLEDYAAAIKTLEAFLDRFPNSSLEAEALSYLYYCYLKTGQNQQAAAVKARLQEKHKGTPFEEKISNPPAPKGKEPENPDMTRRYNRIYTLFIEGQFREAMAEKRVADSLYQKNYWTPQLLYIQSVLLIKERQDDTARAVLEDLINLYPDAPMAAKAKNLLEVLSRRKEIEQYLTDLKIERPQEDTVATPQPDVVQKPVVSPPAKTQQPDPKPKTDPVVTQQPPPAPVKDTVQHKPVPPAVTNKDTAQKKTVSPPPPAKDTAKQKVAPPPPAPAPPKPGFEANAAAPHAVLIVMDKVDGVFVSEAKNAFNRYNKANIPNKPLEVSSEILLETENIRLVVIQPFTNADDALAYYDKVGKIAATEIVPWLPKEKFSFILISAKNLETLRSGKDLIGYKNELKKLFPGRF